MKKLAKTNKKEKTNKGITLIALVITIIVLLILAGISIVTLTGENGILNKADTAKVKTEKATIEEQVKLAVMGSYDKNGKLDYKELKDNLDKVEGIMGVPDQIEELPLEVYVNGYQVTIEKDGSVTIEGEKTGTTPIPPLPTIDQAKEKGEVLDEDKPVTIKDKYDNKIVVPEGFKIATDSAGDVTGGVVIEDVSHGETAGSQFVWIPVGEIKGENGVIKTIELNRYTFAEDGTPTKQGDHVVESYYQELGISNTENAVAKDIEAFKTSVAQNGGYYIGRYEAGDPSATTNRTEGSTKTGTVVSKQGQYAYSYVTQPQSATLSRNMYQNKKFTSDLINSYAWDTAIVFIQEFSGDGDYSRQSRLQSTIARTGEATDGVSKDVRCNIYDMAGNTHEWTTETCSHAGGSCVGRGGIYDDGSNYTSGRYNTIATISYGNTSFRITLYF